MSPTIEITEASLRTMFLEWYVGHFKTVNPEQPVPIAEFEVSATESAEYAWRELGKLNG